MSRHQAIDLESTPIIDSSKINFINEEIKEVTFPVNRFKNQIEILESNRDSLISVTTFQNYINHKIEFTKLEELIKNLKISISNKRTNA